MWTTRLLSLSVMVIGGLAFYESLSQPVADVDRLAFSSLSQAFYGAFLLGFGAATMLLATFRPVGRAAGDLPPRWRYVVATPREQREERRRWRRRKSDEQPRLPTLERGAPGDRERRVVADRRVADHIPIPLGCRLGLHAMGKWRDEARERLWMQQSDPEATPKLGYDERQCRRCAGCERLETRLIYSSVIDEGRGPSGM